MAWAWLTGDSQVRTHISWMGSEPQFRLEFDLQRAPEDGLAEPTKCGEHAQFFAHNSHKMWS